MSHFTFGIPIDNINWDKLQTVSQGTMSTLTNAATTGQIVM